MADEPLPNHAAAEDEGASQTLHSGGPPTVLTPLLGLVTFALTIITLLGLIHFFDPIPTQLPSIIYDLVIIVIALWCVLDISWRPWRIILMSHSAEDGARQVRAVHPADVFTGSFIIWLAFFFGILFMPFTTNPFIFGWSMPISCAIFTAVLVLHALGLYTLVKRQAMRIHRARSAP